MSENKKQTAVDWLFSELKNHLDMAHKHQEELLEQAKAMEKEQICKAHIRGEEDGYYFDGSSSDWESEGRHNYEAQKYYTETYGE